jgi:hypothetical protein
MKKRYLLALGSFCAALGACGGSEYKTISRGAGANATGGTTATGGGGDTGGTSVGGASAASGGASATGGSTGGSHSGGSTSGGTGGVSGNSGEGGASPSVEACSPGIPATSQVPRMKNAAYDNVIRDLLGVTTIASTSGPPSSLLAPDADGDITDTAWQGYLTAADQIASAAMAGSGKSNFIMCDASSTACLTDTIKTFGRKAFRRPLTDTEVTSFLRFTLADPPGTPDEVTEAILYTFLASPSFIMLPELGQTTEADAIQLTDYEVATRLSFLIWNSIPDGALSDAADNGALETKDQILVQAQRMLASKRAQATITAFGHAYLGIDDPHLFWRRVTEHDPTQFPNFSAASVAPMMAEIDQLFLNVVSGGLTFKDLFLSQDAYVNRDTAALYGLDTTQFGGDLTHVELDANQRPGILTRVGFLSTFSHYAETAPELRGSFVETNVLGIDPGPDPGNMQTPRPAPDVPTLRQKVEALVAPAACAGCHQVIDPPGFVLEHYNAVGSWQDQDALGGPIDGTADVMFDDTDTRTIRSPLALMTALAGSPRARRHFAEELVAYASGRAPNPMDACTVDTLAVSLARDDYQILELFADYTQADSFRLRTVGN